MVFLLDQVQHVAHRTALTYVLKKHIKTGAMADPGLPPPLEATHAKSKGGGQDISTPPWIRPWLRNAASLAVCGYFGMFKGDHKSAPAILCFFLLAEKLLSRRPST